VANYLEVKQPRYSKIELGEQNPSLEQSKLLIKLLKINISML
jgi:transcriptional regulator with XRE-family HTH domain